MAAAVKAIEFWARAGLGLDPRSGMPQEAQSFLEHAVGLADQLAKLTDFQFDDFGTDVLDEQVSGGGTVYSLPPPAALNNAASTASAPDSLSPDALPDLEQDWSWVSAPRRAQLRLLKANCWMMIRLQALEDGVMDDRHAEATVLFNAVEECLSGVEVLGLPPPGQPLASRRLKGLARWLCCGGRAERLAPVQPFAAQVLAALFKQMAEAAYLLPEGEVMECGHDDMDRRDLLRYIKHAAASLHSRVDKAIAAQLQQTSNLARSWLKEDYC